MHKLWPHEPGRSRAEFVRLLKEALESLHAQDKAQATPAAGPVSEAIAARLTPDDPKLMLGTPYRLIRRIGEGTSGAVWEAEHVDLGRAVALKVLSPSLTASPAALERFRGEARAVAKLSHTNVVPILDFGKSLDGRVYIAMELCAGETLDVKLRAGPLAWRDAVHIAVEASRALDAAHAAGLVHRDIKPQNLMVTRGRAAGAAAIGADATAAPAVKLLDFGLASALSESGARSVGSADPKERAMHGFAIFGTPEYMAPEQVQGEPVDGRTDVYALGCVLYEMLTGTRAFAGSGVVVMSKQLRETPAPPRVRAPSIPIPADVDAIVMRAMAKRPDQRFPTAYAMRDALEAALSLPARRRARMRKAATTSLTLVCMLGAAGASARWARGQAPVVEARVERTTPAPVADPAPIVAAAAPAPVVTSPPVAVAPSLREARAAAHAHSSDARALETWARAAFRAGAMPEARRATNAWALHDGTVAPRLLLADVLAASGHAAEAKTVLQEWLESHPDATDARQELTKLSEDGPTHEIARR